MGNLSRNVKTALLMVFMAAVLTACGGGSDGGDSGGGDDPTTGAETPTTPNPPPPPSEPVNDGTAVLSWDTPSEREDGAPLFRGDIGGYEINYRLVGDELFTSILVDDGAASEYVIEGLETGSYEIYIHAVDSDGLYSIPSDTVVASI